MARSQAARFLVRIEDLDPQRSRREFETEQLADLQLLGIDWDGEPVRQSERGSLYEEAVAGLNALERLYPCFCTRAEIREAASAPHGELPEGFYPGTCSRLPGAVAAKRIEAGERYAIRLRAQGERIGFTDELLGPRSCVVDDFVVVRADGTDTLVEALDPGVMVTVTGRQDLAPVADEAAGRIDAALASPRPAVGNP